jgi:hypothetical protein
MTLTAHALQPVEVMLKSVGNEGPFTLEVESFSSYLPSHCSGVTELCHILLPPAHALRTVQVNLKSFGNEGHPTPKAETVFCPYLPSCCSGVI